METMTGRERIIKALTNNQPDRVPASPDTSIMIPMKLAGKPTWELEYKNNPSLQTAYIEAVKYFGMDGWMHNGKLDYQMESRVEYQSKVIKKENNKWKVLNTIKTPDGDLNYIVEYPRDNPGMHTVKAVKDFKEDFKKLRHLYSMPTSCDATNYKQQKEQIGELGMICVGVSTPGLHHYIEFMDMEDLTYAYYDYPELFEELVQMDENRCIRRAEMAIDAKVESILTGGSGSLTLQSPELFAKLTFPTVQKVAKMCRQASVISGVHSCGKERYVVELCATESDLDYINPLEIPPMGDCDLADCKENFGDKIALMGNIHTTDVMLNGSVTDVRRESLKAILAAGKGGGFVLSTGDQCGRDTPEENIFEMVRVCKEFGAYPLDISAIKSEIKKLDALCCMI